MSGAERAAILAGRLIFGAYFVYNGVRHFRNRDMMEAYAASKGVKWPTVAVLGTGTMLVLGGLSVLTGVRPKIGASLIAGFLLAVSARMHDFWNVEDPQQQMQEFVNFSKNMALVGAACLVAALPEPWPVSLGREA